MQPVAKPDFLSAQQGAAFEDFDVARSYRNRPGYGDAVFDRLIDLMPASGPILDIGCGTGFLARPLASRGFAVDALDISPAMVELGRALPGGQLPKLRWSAVSFEEAGHIGPYALIVAGESLHWMDWATVLPKCRGLLIPGGKLAIVDNRALPLPWQEDLVVLIARYSTSQHYRPYDTAREIAARGLFIEQGRISTDPDPMTQSIEAYIDSFHARASFSRARMGEAASEFDAALCAAVAAKGATEVIIQRVTEIVWGEPA
ncbi:class I SAM-dependent methyltransferase [Sphingobium nicotianae]|uniref:Methyltransferase domain-containing protein n=1 Tax=Sphingobium nicotianae TaxID=2782607 RepID=A0A9X1DDU7_9SPHN|nr:methyltransferase domain-containing protein [Sphingobium nicotianae]MBT2188410.1 methyltransferase domain-containing protein [Sphingobium nicotianae]